MAETDENWDLFDFLFANLKKKEIFWHFPQKLWGNYLEKDDFEIQKLIFVCVIWETKVLKWLLHIDD